MIHKFKMASDVLDDMNISLDDYKKNQLLLDDKNRELIDSNNYLREQEILLENIRSKNLSLQSDSVIRRNAKDEEYLLGNISDVKVDIKDLKDEVENLTKNVDVLEWGKSFRRLSAMLGENGTIWDREQNKIKIMSDLIIAQEDILKTMKEIVEVCNFHTEKEESPVNSEKPYQTSSDVNLKKYQLIPSKEEMLSNCFVDYSIYGKHKKDGYSFSDFFEREKDKIKDVQNYYNNFKDTLDFFTNRGFPFKSEYEMMGNDKDEIIQKFESYYRSKVLDVKREVLKFVMDNDSRCETNNTGENIKNLFKIISIKEVYDKCSSMFTKTFMVKKNLALLNSIYQPIKISDINTGEIYYMVCNIPHDTKERFFKEIFNRLRIENIIVIVN